MQNKTPNLGNSAASYYQLNRFEGALLCNENIDCSTVNLKALQHMCCGLEEDHNALVVRNSEPIIRYLPIGVSLSYVVDKGIFQPAHVKITEMSGTHQIGSSVRVIMRRKIVFGHLV